MCVRERDKKINNKSRIFNFACSFQNLYERIVKNRKDGEGRGIIFSSSLYSYEYKFSMETNVEE